MFLRRALRFQSIEDFRLAMLAARTKFSHWRHSHFACATRFLLGLAFALAVLPSSYGVAAITPEQRAKIKELTDEIRQAGKLYSEQKFVDCAAKVNRVQGDLLKLLEQPDRDMLRATKSLYDSLKTAQSLLELEGAELDPLPIWKDLLAGKEPMAPGVDTTVEVSFRKDIAPWFITACGNCHIASSRGQFSMASYAALLRGARGAKVLYPGDVKGSTLVEVIETGDMPRGNGKVSPAQLAQLKLWVAQGAKFDGPEPNANLNTFASTKPSDTTPEMDTASTAAVRGGESVSFAKHIAPILVENCNGCHIGARQASGNLRMDTYASMMRGGASGELVAGSNVNRSLLIQKLKGEASGRQMPAGRPPLSQDKIELISTWIREGAKFDGPSRDTEIQVVVSQAWAENASHEELFTRRQERSLAMWSRVLPNDNPEVVTGKELVVLGNVPPSRAKKILKQAEDAVKQVKKQLRASAREPLVKGGITLFALKSRYDYSEFGKMTESRELPKEWLGHWMADPLDVYAVVVSDGDPEEKQFESVVLQVLAGAYVGSMGDVPNWFAEGVARNLVFNTYRRGDERVTQWQSDLPAAMQKVNAARDLLQDRLDEEASGLVGMALTRFMMSNANRRRFDSLLGMLKTGRSFDQATTFAFTSPETLVQGWLGKK